MSKLSYRRKTHKALLLTATMTGVAACTASGPNINQDTACSVTEYHPSANKKICSAGQKVSYMPERWGNEQLPIMFAALNCDHRFQIVHNKSGVSCIFKEVKDVNDISDKKSAE